jgi:hypothetical protein
MDGAFTGWNTYEPNDSSGENCMQVNHNNLKWNDYYAWNDNIKGYFIEFGGTGKAFSVTSVNGTANYPANPKYDESLLTIPSGGLTNDQWQGFSLGNRATAVTSLKSNVMRSRVLIIE